MNLAIEQAEQAYIHGYHLLSFKYVLVHSGLPRSMPNENQCWNSSEMLLNHNKCLIMLNQSDQSELVLYMDLKIAGLKLIGIGYLSKESFLY